MRDESTSDIDQANRGRPRHVAIIMDGNNRWARKRGLSGREGHRAGQQTLERIIEHCAKSHIEVLTVYAFSSENWRRPEEEVRGLMTLFAEAMESKALELHREGVQIRFVGDLSAFPSDLLARMQDVMSMTAGNKRAVLQVCLNYGGQWDITQAARSVTCDVLAGRLQVDEVSPERFQAYLVGADLPLPDLCIRTGGEIRLSNFLLWQLAYSELVFVPTLWPDFSEAEFDGVLEQYALRQRRFGRSGVTLGSAYDEGA